MLRVLFLLLPFILNAVPYHHESRAPIAPDFDAFLVIPSDSAGCFQARDAEPKMDWTRWDWKNAPAGAGKGLNWQAKP